MDKTQQRKYLLLFISVMLFFFILGYIIDSKSYQRFFGENLTLITISSILFIGVLSIDYLNSKENFTIWVEKPNKKLILYFLIPLILGILIIVVDNLNHFPEEINILFPISLIFYPIIVFLVDIIFHVIPLIVFTLMKNSFFKKSNNSSIIWIFFILVSLIEPIYQIIDMINYGSALWVIIYVFLNVFLINLTEFALYKKYGFFSMYVFRLIYYGIWHVTWGYFRLEILFN